MSFVAEKIETPHQIAEFESFALKDPFRNEPLHPFAWAVDRQRGWYFVNLGGGASEVPWMLQLFDCSGLVVNFRGRQRAAGDMLPGAVEVWWSIERIEIPKQHASRAQELLQLVTEALQAYGLHGRSDLTKAVHVNLTAPKFV